MSLRTLSAIAVATLMLSTAAYAGSSVTLPHTPLVGRIVVPNTTLSTASRLTSSMIKKETGTTQQIIINTTGRSIAQGGTTRTPGVRRGGCEEWGCGATNSTKLTGI